jgi:hypothetical protein
MVVEPVVEDKSGLFGAGKIVSKILLLNCNTFSKLFTLQRGHDFGENHRGDHEVSTLVPMIRPLYGATGGRPNAGARRGRRTKAADAGPDDDKVVVICAKPIILILFSKLSV